MFSRGLARVMHIDINSCFATIEQQANPMLRGKPVVVAAYTTDSGCILTASVEAKKRYGIKTGMRVSEGKKLCPRLIVLPSDPPKYRFVHHEIKKILKDYSPEVVPKSIDEFVLKFDEGWTQINQIEVGKEIKRRIRNEVGEWISVSIGFGPNRFLAKTAAGLTKPDGLEIIDQNNYLKIYEKLELMDLCGINRANDARLKSRGIYSVIDFLNASVPQLRSAFGSIAAVYWHQRLRGHEVDEVEFGRASFGHSYSLPKPYKEKADLWPLITRLTCKATRRMRLDGYKARTISIGISYRDGGQFAARKTLKRATNNDEVVLRNMEEIFEQRRVDEVRLLAISLVNLEKSSLDQDFLFEDYNKIKNLNGAIDSINSRWGDSCLVRASAIKEAGVILDRISFGSVR